jgi:prepilin-type N-terminal cleavage/methylation domain-containing protein
MKQGLTIVEIVVALGILAIVSGIALVSLNPFGQVAGARNTQRSLHLTALMSAVKQNIAETGDNSFACVSGPIPATETPIQSQGGYNLAPCIVPTYIGILPTDPSSAGAHYVSENDYVTGYSISRNAQSGQVTLYAPAAELGKAISLTR